MTQRNFPGCIEPWLKNSGTCPTCRYPLVEQPGHDGPVQPADTQAAQAEDDDPPMQELDDLPMPLPGRWPDVERSREQSRGRERAQREQQQEERGNGNLPPPEDVD